MTVSGLLQPVLEGVVCGRRLGDLGDGGGLSVIAGPAVAALAVWLPCHAGDATGQARRRADDCPARGRPAATGLRPPRGNG